MNEYGAIDKAEAAPPGNPEQRGQYERVPGEDPRNPLLYQGPVIHQPGLSQYPPGYVDVLSDQPIEDIPSNLCYAIFVTLCCCLCFGIVSIVYACSSRSASERRDYNMAREEARTSQKWAHAALVVGLIVITINIITRVLLLKQQNNDD